MNSNIIEHPNQDDPFAQSVAKGIYIAYLCSPLFPVLPIFAVIFAYVFEDDAQGYLKTHYQYLIRTFWLALLYFGIASLLIFVLIGFALFPLLIIWWIIRMAKGFKSLLKQRPITSPKSWIV